MMRPPGLIRDRRLSPCRSHGRLVMLLTVSRKVALQAKDLGVDVLVRLNLDHRRAVIGSNVRFRLRYAHLVVPRSVSRRPRPSMRWRADHSIALGGRSAIGWRGSLSGWARCVARYRRSTRQRRRTKRSTLN